MEKLKQKRREQKILVKEVAELLGCSRITIWQYENGKRKPSLDTLVKLAEIYHCTVNDFI